jgi:WD40 repeat protein
MTVGGEGNRLATCGGGQVEVWDLTAGRSLRRWDLGVGVHTVSFLPDGKSLVTANDNGTLYVLELP